MVLSMGKRHTNVTCFVIRLGQRIGKERISRNLCLANKPAISIVSMFVNILLEQSHYKTRLPVYFVMSQLENFRVATMYLDSVREIARVQLI